MKTKLSFLALPFCLGLALSFILGACSGDKGTNSPEPGTSSAAPTYSSPPLSSAVVITEIMFSDFGVDASTEYEKIILMGAVDAAATLPIVKLEFLGVQPAWVSFTGTLPSAHVSLTKAVIDLANPAIPCGTINIQVKACVDAACSAGKYGTSDSKTFEKPAYMCAASSSSITTLYSSSEVSWKFGGPQIVDVASGVPVAVGTATFTLSGDDGQPDMTVVGGTVRIAMSLGVDDDTVVPGKEYSSKETALGSTKPTTNMIGGGDGKEGVQNQDYYLIYLNDGSKYLLYFSKSAVAASWPNWPKMCTYWLATQSP